MKRKILGKEKAQKLLAEVEQEYVFRCHDGKVLRSMQELGEALSVMTDETYSYHWNTEKKDLSNWVSGIIGDKQLARDLEKADSQSLAAWEVATRMTYLALQLH
jgi:hypothetical protein